MSLSFRSVWASNSTASARIAVAEMHEGTAGDGSAHALGCDRVRR